MDKASYNEGYQAAVEAIKEYLANKKNGQHQQSGSAPDDGLDRNLGEQGDPQNAQGSGDQGNGDQGNGDQGNGDQGNGDQGNGDQGNGDQGNGDQGNGDQLSDQEVQAGQDKASGSGEGGKQGGDLGGNRSSSAARKTRQGEVTENGGTFIDKKDGEKLAKEAGYEDDEMGQDEDVNRKWQNIAEKVAKGIGTGRGSRLRGTIDNIYKPAKNWRAELKVFIGHAVGGLANLTGWGRKAFLQYDEIRRYDKQADESLDKVVFMIDTSGSNIHMIEPIVSECMNIVKAKKIPEVTIVWYDYGVVGVDRVKTTNKLDLNKLKNMGGGGGTSFSKAIQDIEKYLKEKHRLKTELLMVFTDGDTCEEVSAKPRWVKNACFVIMDTPSCDKMPWGKMIYINASDLKLK